LWRSSLHDPREYGTLDHTHNLAHDARKFLGTNDMISDEQDVAHSYE
jgi:hypothetical protein